MVGETCKHKADYQSHEAKKTTAGLRKIVIFFLVLRKGKQGEKDALHIFLDTWVFYDSNKISANRLHF